MPRHTDAESLHLESDEPAAPAAYLNLRWQWTRCAGPLNLGVRALLLRASVASTDAVRPRTGIAFNVRDEPEAFDRAVNYRRLSFTFLVLTTCCLPPRSVARIR
jgi:hypothetical protein